MKKATLFMILCFLLLTEAVFADEINDSRFLPPQTAYPYNIYLESGNHFISFASSGGIMGVVVFQEGQFPNGSPVYTLNNSGTDTFFLSISGNYIVLVASGDTEGGSYMLNLK